MQERVHRVLDGELDADELSAEEAAERECYEEAINAALRAVPGEVPSDLAPAVMRRIEVLAAAAHMSVDRVHRQKDRWHRESAWREALAWLWAPRALSLRLRPAYALVGAAALLALLLVGRRGPARAAAPAASVAARVFVHFRLDAPGAKDVALAGDFTGWKPSISLHQVAPGIWSVEIPLDPGLYDYSFVVDGRRWVADPVASRVEDGFGGSNSRIAVLPPQAGDAL